MTIRTLGRGFWLGIIASFLLHALLFSSGSFQIPKWHDDVMLEARLEPVEFKAVSLPKPEVTSEAVPAAPSLLPTPATPSAEPAPAIATPLATAIEMPVVPPVTTPVPEATPPTVPDKPASTPTQTARSLKTLPTRIEIVFELNGMLSGRQTHRWHRDGQRYSLKTEGEVTGLASLFVRGKLSQISEGKIGNLGLMPEYYEMQRLSGKKETLKFDYDNNVIEASRIDAKGKRTTELPLLTSAQDPLSAIYQLAMAAQEDSDGLIVTAGAKRIKGYPYRVLGTEKINTALGALNALHVVRAGDTGNGGMHLWLSPEYHYLPVKVTYVDEDGTEWVLQTTRIRTE